MSGIIVVPCLQKKYTVLISLTNMFHLLPHYYHIKAYKTQTQKDLIISTITNISSKEYFK